MNWVSPLGVSEGIVGELGVVVSHLVDVSLPFMFSLTHNFNIEFQKISIVFITCNLLYLSKYLGCGPVEVEGRGFPKHLIFGGLAPSGSIISRVARDIDDDDLGDIVLKLGIESGQLHHSKPSHRMSEQD